MCFPLRIRLFLDLHNKISNSNPPIYYFYAGKNGDCGTVCVEIDVSTLIPGQYTTIYTMFQKDSKGSNVNLDNVNGLSFEIVQEDDDIVWDERNWGSIRLPDLKIK